MVVGLRYDVPKTGDKTKGKFIAKTKFREGEEIKTEVFHVADDWVFDNYGREVASKLMSRAQDLLFVDLPLTTNGSLGYLVVDTMKIWKVRYFPERQKTIVPANELRDAWTESTSRKMAGKTRGWDNSKCS